MVRANFQFFLIMRKTLLAVLVALVVSAIGLQMLPPNLQTHFAPPKALVNWLPQAPVGWSAVDVPIADTPEMKARVGELLNYTDAVFRIYTRGGRQVSVYIAYWAPGRMEPRLVAAHSPDVCWGESGWRHVAEPSVWDVRSKGGASLGLGQLRAFENQGQKQHVVFWHCVGGRPSGLVDRFVKGEAIFTLDQFLRNPRAPKYEQWFVRLSSNEPLEQLGGEPLWEALIEQLAPIARH